MASSFLTRQANKQAKKIEQEYGASAYGGTASLRPSSVGTTTTRSAATATGGESTAPVSRASSFLTRQAQKSAAKIDRQYGTDAYGGSRWTALDKESGFQSWMDELNSFSQRVSEEYAGREGQYQNTEALGKYRDDTLASIGAMQNRGDIYRNYFRQNRSLYGDEAVDSILTALSEGGNYLEGVRNSLNSEYDYWSQWESEDAYNDYQRRANLDIDAAKAELADLEEQLEEAERERNTTRNIMVGTRYMTSKQIEDYGADRDEAQARYDDIQGRVSALQEDIEIAQQIAQARKYNSYRGAADWEEKSRYRSTANGKDAVFNAWTGMYSETGFDDITYDYINRNEEAIGHQIVNDVATNASLLGVDNSFLRQMTDDEIATFNYIYATQGADPAYEYIAYLASDLNYRQRIESEAEWAAYANEHPIGSSVFSVLESPLKGLSYIGQIADYAEDGKIDQNAAYNKFSYLNGAIRNEVSSIVEEDWGEIGSSAYGIGMSLGDFIYSGLLTGALGGEALLGKAGAKVASNLTLGIMSSGAAADKVIEAKDRGLSDNQALALGTIAGAAEFVTEKFSLDALLEGKWERGALQYILKNAFTEGSEEVGSDLINLFADILISKDQSEWQMSIDAYISEGYSEGEAFGLAVADQAAQMGVDFIGGAISGGLLSGGYAGINAVANAAYNRYNQQLVQENDVKNTPVLETNPQEGPVQSQNEGEIDSSIPEATRQAVEMLVRGEEISGNQAARIAESEEAVALLSQLTGEEVNTDAPISRVKSDIRALASREGRTSGEAGVNSRATQSGAQTQEQQNAERPTAQRAYDILRVQQAATTLGESGSRALTAAYDGSVDAGSFYAGFAAYYEAGVSGMDMGRVRSEYAQDLTEAQRYAAYTAGQNDAAASLQREREGVQFATVYGDEAGFIPSEHSRNLSQDTVRFYNALGRATGTKITVTAATGEGGANGWYSNGTVYIAADAESAGSVVAKHEITHRLQEIAPEAYRTYRDYAVNVMAERDGSTAALVERYKARYAQSGVNLTTEQAMDEIAADFTEALTVDPSRFDTLAQEHRSVARRVLDALRDFISKVKALFKGRSDRDRAAMSEYGVSMEALERAAQLWEEALRAGQAQVSTMTEAQQRVEFSDVNTRYSLREKEPPKKTGVAYKVFFAKNGELYPPMVANPGGEGTPVGVWLDADVGQAAPPSKTGRAQVQAGGRGTNAAKGSLAFRPGWHLGDIPLAKQFARKNPATGVKDLFPADFVWAECEYAMDVDYQEEAMSYGYTENGKFRHSYAGLPKLPTDGYYRYRTNPNPDTVPWIITGAMRVRRILTDAETDAICREAGVEPMQRQGGPLDEAGLERLGLEVGDVTGNTRFSMKSAVEDNGTLLALHNLTEDKLRSALRLGGFPMPSIAVTRADIPHTNFGDITLVMSRQTVDPRANRRNTVYSADAWTPTFPAIEYEADPQAERRISRRIGELSAQVDPFFQDDLRRVQYGLDDYLNRHGGEEGLARWAMDNYGLKAAYLEEQGQHIAAVTTQREADRGYNMDRAEQYQAVADVLGTTDPEAIGSMNLKELRDQHGEALERAYPGMTKSALRMSGVLRQVQAYLEGRDSEPTYEAVTDSAATRRAVDNALDQAGYERWVRELYSGIEAASGVYNNKERFTPSGNRRSFQQTHYPVTLDNITKAMAGQNNGDSRNVSGFYGIKSLRAGMAERFKSIADMHRLEGRLQNLTQEEADAISNALDSRLSSIMEELAEKSPGGGRRYDYMQMDAIGNILMEIADGGTYTIDSIMRRLNEEYHYHVGNELAAKIRDLLFDVSQMPVNLFEAKPERSVHFDEVLAAVLPDNVGSGLSDDLLAAGVGQVLTYEEGNDTDRLAKVNSVEGARFSLKDDGDEAERRLDALRQERDELTERLDAPFSELSDAEERRLRNRLVRVQHEIDMAVEQERRAAVRTPLSTISQNLGNYRRSDLESLAEQISNGAWDGYEDLSRADLESALLDALNERMADMNPLEAQAPRFGLYVRPVSGGSGRSSVRGGGDILRQNAALQEENSLLRERVEYWRGQTRRTERVTTDKKAVERAARELIRAYNSSLETAEIAGDLQSLYDYIASGRDGSDELTYTEARRRSDAIARKLVDSAAVLEDDAYRDYADLRSYLRSTPLSISAEDSHDIADFGDFRRRNFGRMTIRSGPTNIDQVYQEMSGMWPEFFDETRESTPSDQLVHIAEVLDGIYRVTERNPFSGYFDAAVTDASNEIMERFFDLPQTRPTFADRQARKLDDAKAAGRRRLAEQRERSDARLNELRQQNRERVQRAIQRERETRARQIDRLKTRYAARDAAGRERRSARELRARISRHVADLSRRLLRPSDKQHIPEQLRTAVAAMLDAINLESVYTVDPETGRRRKGGNGDPTKRTEAFRALRQAYANITKDGADYTLIIDPDLMDNLTELEAMRDTPLAEMGTAQLSTIWATVRAVEASIRTANRMLGESRFRTISQVAEGIRNDNIMRQDRGDYRGILGKVDRLVNLDMLTPQGYFHRMGPTGDALFRMLRSAQDRHIEIMRSAQEATRDIIGSVDTTQLERETHTFDVDGQKLTMSTAQIMALYELMKRQQAQEHIFTGGIRPEAVRTGRGLRENRRADAVHVTVEDLAEITGVLTEEQVKIADALQKYMGGQLAELGNQASMEVYGYRKFTEPNYFPIQVDRNQTQRDIAKEAQAQTIAGRGFTKGTVPRANNAVMVGSIFDIFASHVNDMATYSAWLPTMENVRRIRDFTFRDSEGNRTGTVKSVIERVFGRNGNAYLNKLVDDLNQGVRTAGSGNFMDSIVGNYKAAAVAANLRVIAQQPTAILRALNTMDAKYLLAGTVRRGDWEKVMKYAPIARWKDWGYFDINTGRQMKDVLLGSSTRLEKLRQAGMAGAGKADSIAWARLWNAVEAETKDRRPGLKPGTDAFYRAVGDRFSEIVDQTQVVDGILQRSQIMRSSDALTKISTSFMGEPTKSYNMFVNAVYDLRHATSQQGRSRAKRALARTTTALAVSFTVNAIMQSLVDALRDDDKETDYWEKVFQAFTGFTGDEETVLDYWNSFWSGNLEASYNPLAYMPYFKDLVSIAQGYDVTRMDMEAIEKVWSAFTNMRSALSGEGRYSIAGASANMLAEVARLFGLPVANIKRDVQAVATTAAIETDNYLMQYRMDKALLNIGYQGNRSGFMDILYAASVNDPEAYEIIYEDMVASGITEDQIRTAMESRMKEDQGVESVDELSRRYLTPNQERTYDRLYGQVSSSPVWRAASPEQREAVEEDIYALTTGTDAGVKLQEKIDGGAAYGITEADYLLYLAAREIADGENEDPEKRNGSIDQAEAQAAIDMLTGLSDEGRAYLWQSTNKGWSEEKNPYR